MLRTRRLLSARPPSRLSLPSCTCRFASTATKASTSAPLATSLPSSPPPPEPLRRTRSPLYTVAPLPPLPPPLPVDAAGTATFTPTSISHNNPSVAHEQLAVLNACLASGDITRAEEVAKRIKAAWASSAKPSSAKLSAMLPSRVHADFLRAYLSSSLVRKASPSLSNGDTATVSRAKLVHKAWTYFDSLVGEQWESTVDSRKVNAAMDASVVAVMMKGLVASGEETYHPSSLTDPDNWLRPITHLLPYLTAYGISLLDVLRDPVFDIELPSYLGKVDRVDVLEAIEKTAVGRSGWSEWESTVKRVREIVQSDKEGREAFKKSEVAELDPTRSVRPSFLFPVRA